MKQRNSLNALVCCCVLGMALWCVPSVCAQTPTSTDSPGTGLRILVTDAQQYPIVGASVLVSLGSPRSPAAGNGTTDEHGVVAFPEIASGTYVVRVDMAGFDSYRNDAVTVNQTERSDLHAVLVVGSVAEQVSVTADPGAASAAAGSSVPAAHLDRRTVQQLPLATAQVNEVLAIVPGVIRSGTGEMNMEGAPEQQSGLLINGFNSADPATGNYRLSLPVDSVEAVQVFMHPYTAEYGQLIGGLTKIETRAGGDQWHAELNDFLPDLRIVGHKVVGIAEDSPHLNAGGPMFDGRLHVSQSLSYTIAKRPVRGLAFPFNETRTEAESSFTQLDLTAGPRRSDTLTVGYFPQRMQFVGLDVFRPQPVTPNAKQDDFVVALRDRWQVGPGLLESALSVRRFGTVVWPQGSDPHALTPTGERGSYFANVDRSSSRLELFEVYALPTKHVAGTHDIKFGVDINAVASRVDFTLRPVEIVGADGTLTERIDFEKSSTIRARDQEAVAFVQDRWSLRPDLNVDAGIRYENQRLADGQGVAPRLGIAWAPASRTSTVLRGGIGLFFDKVPLNIRSFSRYPARIVTDYAADGSLIETRRFATVLVSADASEPFDSDPSNAEAAFVPDNLTWNVQLDRTVTAVMALRANFVSSHTRNIYIVNPEILGDGSNAIVLQSTGRSNYQAFEATARFTLPRRAFSITYVRSKGTGDLNNFNSAFGDFAVPLVRPNQFSRLASDIPHRLVAWGTFSLPHRTSLSPVFEVRSGFPYSVLDAEQRFVGLRNADATRFPLFLALDLEAAKEIQATRKYAVRLSVRAFNVTNHFNPRDVHANLGDPEFGRFLASYHRYFAGGFDIIF